MTFVLSLVGTPNVGKSTLFNRLTKTRDALVADTPGLTRDRKYGAGRLGLDKKIDRHYVVVDCGGLTGGSDKGIEGLMAEQVWQAVSESDAILFVVDGRAGITSLDEEIAQSLRKTDKPIYLVVNKTEGQDITKAAADFYSLGFGEPYPISAAHNIRVKTLIENIIDENYADFKVETKDDTTEYASIRISIVGRPNVGKSTLINRLTGENRLLTFDMPGTTRDSIEVEFKYQGKDYLLIDTAGVRKRSKVKETVEKFSIIKAVQSMEGANAVILLVDANDGFTDQDAVLLSMALDFGRPITIGINKWDGLDSYKREQIKTSLEQRLHFINFVPVHFVSALHGSGIRDLFKSASMSYEISLSSIPTNALSKSLERAVRQHAPPLVKGHRIKLRYAHQGGKNPPVIVVHGNQTESIPGSYKRFLINHFRKDFSLHSTPVKLVFKSTDNPYKGKKNTLNRKQVAKKKRLKKHTSKK